jgi:hypothetical protein
MDRGGEEQANQACVCALQGCLFLTQGIWGTAGRGLQRWGGAVIRGLSCTRPENLGTCQQIQGNAAGAVHMPVLATSNCLRCSKTADVAWIGAVMPAVNSI